MERMFFDSRFNGHEVHDSPLGYLCILQGYSDLPKNHPRAAKFQQLRAVAASLDLDDVGAALFIYMALYPTDLGIHGLNDFTLAYRRKTMLRAPSDRHSPI